MVWQWGHSFDPTMINLLSLQYMIFYSKLYNGCVVFLYYEILLETKYGSINKKKVKPFMQVCQHDSPWFAKSYSLWLVSNFRKKFWFFSDFKNKNFWFLSFSSSNSGENTRSESFLHSSQKEQAKMHVWFRRKKRKRVII